MLLLLPLIFCGFLLSPDPAESFMSFEGRISSPFAHYNEPAQFVSQKLSHFNNSEKRQWKQYFYSNTNNSRDANLNFLIMGGEWNIELSDVQDGRNMIMKWAKHFGASVYSLGHRFYGKSQPLGNLKAESLKYLTAEEAIADAAMFIQTINSQKNVTHPKWVVFGMSYPGALAVWFRQKYPNLTVGCVASSPPVRAVVDNDYLFKTVENNFNKYVSENCTSDIRRYFSKYQSLLATEQGRRKIGACFEGSEKEWTEKDAQLYTAMAVLMDMSKSGFNFRAADILDDDFEHKKLKKICAEFKQLADEIEDVPPQIESLKACKQMSYKNLVQLIQNTHAVSVVAYFRAFAWQLCTEFGWFPTIKVTGGAIDDAGMPLRVTFFRFFTDACQDVFGSGINATTIANAVKHTNELYGGSANYNGTNLMIVNGSEDPIHPLSLYDTPNDSVKSIIVPDISHTKDLRGESESDPQSLKNARERVKAEIGKWLNASFVN